MYTKTVLYEYLQIHILKMDIKDWHFIKNDYAQTIPLSTFQYI